MITATTPGIGERIDALLRFLPLMESRVAGEWRGGEADSDGIITMPWFHYSDEVLAFIEACYENGWVDADFDWTNQHAWVRWYAAQPERVARAKLRTIQKLLTAHLRADRFVEGHLAGMIEDGHVAAILRRLSDIRRRL